MKRRTSYEKKYFMLFVALLIFFTSFPSVFATGAPRGLDWNLPVAISERIEPCQLASLTDDELRLLHQPYVDIANSISLELGVNIEIGTIDCYFITRDDILYAITNITLAEHDFRLRELAVQVRNIEYSSRILGAALDSGYDYVLVALVGALNYGAIDPVDAYNRIQQNGTRAFYEEIEPLFNTLYNKVADPVDAYYRYEIAEPYAMERWGPVYMFERPPTFASNILRNQIAAEVCPWTMSPQWVEHSIAPRLTPVGPWTWVLVGHHISAWVDPGFAGSPNTIISIDNGGRLRRSVPGGTETVWWESSLITGFQVNDRTFRLW
ncbi:MAG: hypothetical protein FWC92_11340 [Defluviitaleaceae bacterium]|nr:hypothetical protein [Defluviitaleaceae bacterium]